MLLLDDRDIISNTIAVKLEKEFELNIKDLDLSNEINCNPVAYSMCKSTEVKLCDQNNGLES